MFKAENEFLEEVALKMNNNFNKRTDDIIKANTEAMNKGKLVFSLKVGLYKQVQCKIKTLNKWH